MDRGNLLFLLVEECRRIRPACVGTGADSEKESQNGFCFIEKGLVSSTSPVTCCQDGAGRSGKDFNPAYLDLLGWERLCC